MAERGVEERQPALDACMLRDGEHRTVGFRLIVSQFAPRLQHRDGAHECHSCLADGLRADLAELKAGVANVPAAFTICHNLLMCGRYRLSRRKQDDRRVFQHSLG